VGRIEQRRRIVFSLRGNHNLSAAFPFRSIDHVQLAMPRGEEQQARVFYQECLGLSEVPKPPHLLKRGGIWFQSGEVVVHLGIDANFRPATKAHPAFRCTDYADLLKRLDVRGVPVAHDDQLFGGKAHCYITDPFGNRIELIAE
jgi:catechol 2,3-dioxygenase-like lactoylglutathione lyase family enzyme